MIMRLYFSLILLLSTDYLLFAGRKPKVQTDLVEGQLSEQVSPASRTSHADELYEDADHYYLSSLTEKITPETTIFAFDLHDVIFQKLSGERAACILRALPRMIWYIVKHPFFLYDVSKISPQTAIWEDTFYQLVDKYPGLKKFEDDFFAAANAFKPIDPMVDIIKQLHAHGYKLYILSNIGGKSFILFKEKFPELFSYFSGAYTPCQENNYNCKPNISFYTEFKEHICTLGNNRKQCIFIDDLETNLQAAIASNKLHNEFLMAGIHCTSVDRVKAVLLDNDILVSEEIQKENLEKAGQIVENV